MDVADIEAEFAGLEFSSFDERTALRLGQILVDLTLAGELPVVLGASIIGAVVGIGMKLNSKLREGRYVPFGPFLAGSGLAVLLIGAPRILDWLGWV